jgi:hypothetical protein
MIGETEAPPAGVSGGSNQPLVPSSDRVLNLVGSSARNWPPRRWLPARTVRVDGRAAGWVTRLAIWRSSRSRRVPAY